MIAFIVLDMEWGGVVMADIGAPRREEEIPEEQPILVPEPEKVPA